VSARKYNSATYRFLSKHGRRGRFPPHPRSRDNPRNTAAAALGMPLGCGSRKQYGHYRRDRQKEAALGKSVFKGAHLQVRRKSPLFLSFRAGFSPQGICLYDFFNSLQSRTLQYQVLPASEGRTANGE